MAIITVPAARAICRLALELGVVTGEDYNLENLQTFPAL
jgi:hypothetical protein